MRLNPDHPDHPFNGIIEKLKRADENILNLKTEIDAFLNDGKYPVIPHPDTETWQEAVDYHRTKLIPKRFSVLAGEIVHHLRSSLDHIVWHFSNVESGPPSQNVIEFPIFENEPRQKDQIKNYERKIEGIKSPDVLKLIKDLQPYNAGADVADESLLIVHNMDRFDKHRELVIVRSAVSITFPSDRPDLLKKMELFKQGKLPQKELVEASRDFKNNSEASPNIAFGQFGKRDSQPVIPGLERLLNDVGVVVAGFAMLINPDV